LIISKSGTNPVQLLAKIGTIKHLGPEEVSNFPRQYIENRDCPGKSWMDGHLTYFIDSRQAGFEKDSWHDKPIDSDYVIF